MEEVYTIIEVADNLQYGIVGTILSAVSGIVGYSSARKAEKAANKAAKNAQQEALNAANALAARERRSIVPGFGNSDEIPGYSDSYAGALGPQPGSAGKNPLGFYGDMDVVEGPGYGAGSEIKYDPSGNIIFNEAAITRSVQKKLRANKDFMRFTKNLPKTKSGKPIFPDPNTPEGKAFYATLPKSILEMAGDPNKAQMYKGSNIVNPYANVQDISAIAEDVSDLLYDRSDLIQDRTGMLTDTSELLTDRSDLFESTTDLGTDLSTGLQDLSVGRQDLSERLVDLRSGAQDYSGLASDTSILASNPYANLQIATQAADLKAQQSDQALANTLSTIRATGAGAGGATAIAQAALQSKLGIAATIEQQEARNVQARAEGQQQIEQIRMGESRRLQDVAFAERIRLEGLREREGLRIDETRIGEGRRLQDLSISEGRRLQELGISEGRRLQDLSISERLREQGLTLDESLRLQDAQRQDALRRETIGYDAALERDRVRFGEAGRLQEAQANEQIRLQNLRMAEQQRLQQADAMSREYQFSVAETREQNRLNRLQEMKVQKMQTSADLQASKVAAKASRQGALTQAIGGVATAAVGETKSIKGLFSKQTSDRRLKKNIKLIGKSTSGLNIYMFEYIDKVFGDGIYQGVMSDEIPQHAVIKGTSGYDMVDYSKIDVDFKKL